jgi:hypothetical protein
MTVLLHAYNLGFSVLEVATRYHVLLIRRSWCYYTNLCAGMMGAEWGIKYTPLIGLVLQMGSYGLLFGNQRPLYMYSKVQKFSTIVSTAIIFAN